MKRTTAKTFLVTGLLTIFFGATTTFAQSNTEFTYQGKLSDGGIPANGNYDIEFKIYDCATCNPTEGTGTFPISIVKLNVPVTNGIFTVGLDYGEVFDGLPTWIRIAVRPAGAGGLTILDPRQKVNSVPNAIYSVNAGAAGEALNSAKLGGHFATEFVFDGDPRLSDPRPPTPSFTITGTGTANTFNAAMQFNISGNRVLSVTGTENLFAGIGAGISNTSGTTNTFVGSLAGNANSTGGGNSFFGRSAGRSNINGDTNSFFGADSGRSNTNGLGNSFFGKDSGYSHTEGGLNSFFGVAAGYSTTGALNNSFFGAFAGYQNTGADNSFFGSDAGRNNTTATGNSFFGNEAGKYNSTGFLNSFFGALSGRDNTVGTSNSFFGNNAGLKNVDGASNSFFGNDAGQKNVSGSDNVAFGYQAGFENTSGANNTLVGVRAGQNVLGSGNTFLGKGTGPNAGTGTNNTFLGLNAGKICTSCSGNVAIGPDSETGSANMNSVAIGANAKATANNSMALGADAIAGQANEIKIGTNTNFLNINAFSTSVYELLVQSQLKVLSIGGVTENSFHLCRDSQTYILTSCSASFTKEDKAELDKAKSEAARLTDVARAQTTAIKSQRDLLDDQQRQIADLKLKLELLEKLVCSQNPDAELCRTLEVKP